MFKSLGLSSFGLVIKEEAEWCRIPNFILRIAKICGKYLQD